MTSSNIHRVHNTIFILSANNQFYGYGHYHKSIQLQNDLKQYAIQTQLVLYQSQVASYPNFHNYPDLLQYLIERKCRILLLDKRENPLSFIQSLRQHQIFTIAFDSQGPEKNYYDYVIDAIPHFNHQRSSQNASNLQGIAYLKLPHNNLSNSPAKKSTPLAQKEFHVLVYLGSLSLQEKRQKKLHHLLTQLNKDLQSHPSTTHKHIHLSFALKRQNERSVKQFQKNILSPRLRIR